MKEMMSEEDAALLLAGMPQPKKLKRVTRKRHVNTKNVPTDIAVRRLVAEEIGEAEPTKDEKFILLQKYGVVAPRIDRLVTKPKWMSEDTWKRKQNNWFKMTHGMARRYQQKSHPNNRPTPNSQQPQNHRSWGEIRFKNPQAQVAHNQRHQRPQTTRNFRPNSGQTRTGNFQS